MAPRSRTGKLMQGLFGRFGKKNPPQPTIDLVSIRQQRQRAQLKFEDADSSQQDWGSAIQNEKEFPIVSRFDDDEETNWDDAETLGNEYNPIVPRVDRQQIYAQPVARVVPPTPPLVSDLDEWAEALPAATVQSSNVQEARRSNQSNFKSSIDDIWDDAPSQNQENSGESTFSASSNPARTAASGESRSDRPRLNYVSGFWAGILAKLRHFLPAPLRQLSDAILTAIVVAIVTVGIWFVDGFFVPGIDRSVTSAPPTPIVAPIGSDPKISPEQAFTEAIQSQLSGITSQYPDDIIETLNIDINRDRLVVQLAPSWYTLDDDLQNTLTDRMWLQAQSNHFTKLEIQDSQGVAIARSPVVGKHPIILQRRSS
jgi:hypothetical protein